MMIKDNTQILFVSCTFQKILCLTYNELNCSVAEYMGIEGSGLELLKDQPPCDMKDIIRLRSYNKSDHQSAEKCLPLCTEESTAFSDSVATMSDKAVEDYLPADFGINLR